MRRIVRRASGQARRLGGWLKGYLTPSPAAWNAATWSLVALWALIFLSLLLFDVVPTFTAERLAGLVGVFAILTLAGLVALLAVGLISLLNRRYWLVLFAVLPVLVMMSGVVWAEKGMALAPAILVVGFSLTAGSIAALARRTPRRIGAVVFLILGLLPLAVLGWGLLAPYKDPNPAFAGYRLAGTTLDLPDPGKPGPYKVRYLTYGGGTDRYRPEFAAKATFRSQAVDASKLDKVWKGPGGWLRTLYWGFGPKAFPVQGRIWAPDGPGPFPLVLIVHGNHAMEQFSDPGYAYLGELLASQGFILVSVDENFINSSLADLINPLKARSGDENDARAWMLLEHLVQWQGWSADPQHPLYGKVDWDRIGLIGHSRGGEAMGIAAAFNKLDAYPDDATQAFRYHFNLRAVAAIAPVDGQYQARHRPIPLKDVNYFVIHGSQDGDAFWFAGSSQYSRDELTGAQPAFKASVYVKDADHNQFNTTWGRNDLGLPWEFLLENRGLLSAEAQRQVAKVYLSAFLQDALQDRRGYRPFLQDPRRGAGWLPSGYLATNYADSDTAWAATFDEDLDPATAAAPGARIVGRNLSVWREDFVKLKLKTLDTQVALIGWDDRFSKARASYSIDLGAAAAKASPEAELVFSASSAGVGSLPDGFKPPKKTSEAKAAKDQPLDWTVTLVDARGVEARLPLSHDQVLYPQIKGHTRRFNAIDGAPASEIVMRRYRFALADLKAANPALDLAALKSVRFDFDRSPRGAIALDDVGIAPIRR